MGRSKPMHPQVARRGGRFRRVGAARHAAEVSRRLCGVACRVARVGRGRGRGRRLDGDPVQERPGAHRLLCRCVLHHLSAAALFPCNHPGRHRAEEGEGKSRSQGNRPCLDRDFIRVIFFTSFHSHRIWLDSSMSHFKAIVLRS